MSYKINLNIPKKDLEEFCGFDFKDWDIVKKVDKVILSRKVVKETKHGSVSHKEQHSITAVNIANAFGVPKDARYTEYTKADFSTFSLNKQTNIYEIVINADTMPVAILRTEKWEKDNKKKWNPDPVRY